MHKNPLAIFTVLALVSASLPVYSADASFSIFQKGQLVPRQRV